jgi:hypothetical protein
MRRVRPFGYAVVSLAATAAIVACAGRSGGALPAVPGAAAPQTAARIPARDLGRRDPRKPVDVFIALRFTNPAGLDRFVNDVSNPHSAQFRHFLKREQFVERFSPSAAAQARVIAALERAGFTIERTYANRLAIVASAPSAAAERLFATRIHDFDQRGYGTRFANVTPARIPRAIAADVSAVELNNIVYARTAVHEEANDAAPDASDNVIVNGGFERKMNGWTSCGRVAPHITGQHPFAGRYDALAGSLKTTSGLPAGWSAICQRLTIPANATLTAYLYDVTNAKTGDDTFQAVGLMNKPGSVVAILRKSLRNNGKWVKTTFDLTKYAGRDTYLFFGVHGNGAKKLYNTQYVDAVTLTGSAPTPTPSPTPTGGTPTPSPTPTPPKGPVTPGPDAPLTGPTYGPQNGWAPRGVADGFDFPVQHGYAGTGITVGIVIDQTPHPDDLTSYYTYNDIANPKGTLTYKTLGTTTPAPGDPTEATLDIEAVIGLAPNANIVVYLTPDLSNQYILSAYTKALDQGLVSVVDSSFGECESQDANFVDTSDADAEAGAAMGITFIAAAGDEGSACYNGTTNVIGVNAPASGPHFLGVGGNQSLATGSVANPAVWNDRTAGTGVGIGGGGVSATWTTPPYQAGLGGNPSSTSNRNVPDIALPAVNDDLFIYASDQLVEGTSWSSSIATALLASGEQFCGPFGWVNPALYAEYASQGETPAFFDVTSGFNGGYAGNLSSGYTAAKGYDNASGIGMPNGITFDAALCGRSTKLARHI